jgi:hypothetical protein
MKIAKAREKDSEAKHEMKIYGDKRRRAHAKTASKLAIRFF